MNLAQALIDAVALGVLYAVVALGIALLFGVMRLVNFAYGELITTAAYILVLTKSLGAPWRAVLAVAAAIAMAAIMELAFRPFRNASPTTALIATFAVSFLLQSAFTLAFGTQGTTIEFLPGLNQAFQIGDLVMRWITLISLLVGAALLGAMALLLGRTDIGLQMRAVAGGLRTARILGVRANRIMAAAFLASGFIAGMVALLLSVQRPLANPSYGFLVMVPALVGVVVGGMDRLVAGTLGGFAVGFSTVMLGFFLPANARVFLNSALFALVIVVLLVKPHGLFVKGRRVMERV